ncbi:MAG: glycosyltransferase [Acidobacteriota bacterium]
MTIGLLLPRGSGPVELARSGQWGRFARHYLPAYAAAFERVVLLVEDLPCPAVAGLEGVELRRLARGRGRWDSSAFSDLDLVRAFQAPDLALLPGPTPVAVATYGYDYAEFARLERRPWRLARDLARHRAGARRAALLFTPARFLQARALRVAPGARTELLPNGVDVAAFTPPAHLLEPRRALFVGRLTPQKGLPTLLRALSLLPRPDRPSLTLVGDGPLRARLQRLAQRLGLRVQLTGVLPHETLGRVYQEHDLFVLPSVAEGHSKSVIEAMACGLACVVSDCEGNRSLIEPRRTGWLFPRGDAGGLAATLRQVLALDPAELFRVRRAARLAAEQRHDLRALVARELEVVRELAGAVRAHGMEAKYLRSGAYHWRETDTRQLSEFNAPLRSRYRSLIALAREPCQRVLDAGCGDGALSAALARRSRLLVGCDPCRQALRLARGRVAGGLWVCARLEALPFRNDCFNLAVAADVLEHVEHASAASRELARVLGSGASLVASAPVAAPGDPAGRFHAREFGRRGLVELLSGDFEIEVSRYSHPGWLLRLYRRRLFGRSWPKWGIDLLSLAGIDLWRWPAGRSAAQASVRARPRGAHCLPAQASAASASAPQVAGAMKRKCG